MKNISLKFKKTQSGAAILLAVMVLTAILVSVSLTVGLSSIAENQINLYQTQSGRLFVNADGCMEEALTRLNRDNNYSGDTINLDLTLCAITVSGSGNSRTITVVAIRNDHSKSLEARVTLSPFDITSWQELTI